jgi:hypothetical protein
MPKVPFPHMMARDVPLFASFVLTPAAKQFERWEFDVHVGDGHLEGQEFDPAIHKLALEVSRLRIDAVGWSHGVPTVYEVKPRASLSAYGQVKAYQLFFLRDKFIRPNMGIITDWVTPDMRWLCAAEGIQVHEVHEASLDELIQACHIVRADCSQLIRIPSL